MPTIDVSKQDLCNLIGKNLSLAEIQDEAILFAKGEVEKSEGDLLKLEMKDTNRPDLWSVEGIARELKGHYSKPTFPEYTTTKSTLTVHVSKTLKNIRPYTVCAVVKNLDINENILSQMIQLQEKISDTFGRKRKEVAIGIYDYNKIEGPINFTAIAPDEINFVPLGMSKQLTPQEILEKHPKGKEYSSLLLGKPKYPIFIDSSGYVLSMPPIINSEHTGKITTKTENVFIECSGFNLNLLNTALNVIVAALADRGGKIETVDVQYPDQTITTPGLSPKKITVKLKDLGKTGLNLKPPEIMNLLFKANYNAVRRVTELILEYPAYRQDIMHTADVIEDLIISYGYNKIEPEEPALHTKGILSDKETYSRKIATIMAGLGLQEIMSYTLTNKKSIFHNMGLEESHVVEIENPISSRWSVFRNSLLSSVLEFLSNNTHRELPQKIFEIGDCILINEKTHTKTEDLRNLSVAITDTNAGYEDISSILDAFFRSLGLKYTLVPHNHPSFILGRSAKVMYGQKRLGLIGEISPQVLNNWNIDAPVAAFELELNQVFEILK